MAPVAPAHGFDIIATGSTVDTLMIQRMSKTREINRKKKDQETRNGTSAVTSVGLACRGSSAQRLIDRGRIPVKERETVHVPR